MMMCLITGINSYLQKFVIIKKFMIQLEKKNMRRGKILLYGHTHESAEDRFYQRCLKQMQENDCRHVYGKRLRACNVGCMLPYMNYTPRTLEEILEGVEMETK